MPSKARARAPSALPAPRLGHRRPFLHPVPHPRYPERPGRCRPNRCGSFSPRASRPALCCPQTQDPGRHVLLRPIHRPPSRIQRRCPPQRAETPRCEQAEGTPPRTRLLPQVNIWGGLKSVQLQFSRESFFGTPRTGHTLAGSSHGYGYERAQSQQLIPTRKDHESGGLRHSPPRSLQVRGRASRPLTAPGLCGVDPARLREVSAGQRQLREAGAAASLCDRWGPRRRPGRIPAPEPGGARGDPPGDPGCPI